MIDYDNIRHVHLEISTRCNAACPDCPRNFRGVDVIDNYPITEMTLEQVKQIFPEEFIRQLYTFLINGNYGDFITARDGLKIVEYIRQVNPKCMIEISTNASGKPKIWESLGRLGTTIMFRLDGLADTHHLYRQNTNFDLIIDNAKKFIEAAKHNPLSKAVWAFIPFSHNRHQIEECRRLSQDLGFHEFQIVNAGRDTMPVFNSKGKFTHSIGDWTGSQEFEDIFHEYSCYVSEVEIELEKFKSSGCEIKCYAKQKNEIYVSANGEVYPCCWLGFYPLYGVINGPVNSQLRPLIYDNNALEHGLKKSIEWFSGIEKSWHPALAHTERRIITCERTCGVKS
jgi:MoaA/NifB/PqqE/SkfB family radical SAM enzyme